MKRNTLSTFVLLALAYLLFVQPIATMAQGQQQPTTTKTQTTASQQPTTTTATPSPSPAKNDLGLQDVTPKSANPSTASAPASKKHRRHHRRPWNPDPNTAARRNSNYRDLAVKGEKIEWEIPKDDKQQDGLTLKPLGARTLRVFIGETVQLRFVATDKNGDAAATPDLALLSSSNSMVIKESDFDEAKLLGVVSGVGTTTVVVRAKDYKATAKVKIIATERPLADVTLESNESVIESGKAITGTVNAHLPTGDSVNAIVNVRSNNRNVKIAFDQDDPMSFTISAAEGITQDQEVTITAVHRLTGLKDTIKLTVKAAPAPDASAQPDATKPDASKAQDDSQKPKDDASNANKGNDDKAKDSNIKANSNSSVKAPKGNKGNSNAKGDVGP